MSDGMDPLGLAQDEAVAVYKRVKLRALDWAKRYVTAALLKVLLPSLGALALAVVALPALAAIACGVSLALLALYSINATRLLKRKDAELRWAWIANHRLHQRHLDHQIATDNVTLALLGERTSNQPYRYVSQDLRSALAYAQRKALAAEQSLGTAATPARAAAHRAGIAVPERPPIEPIKARKAAREAEHAALTAVIESLATPADIERAVNANDRTQRERRNAAIEADQAARERVRMGMRPTVREPEHTITLAATPSGDRTVRTGRNGPTPEEIAAGTAARVA